MHIGWPKFTVNTDAHPQGLEPAMCLFTFLCLPLKTTAKAPCPTRSFRLYSKSPTVSMFCQVSGDTTACDGEDIGDKFFKLPLIQTTVCPRTLSSPKYECERRFSTLESSPIAAWLKIKTRSESKQRDS